MRQDIAAQLLLSRLYQLDIRQHALILERPAQLTCDRSSRVYACQRNELEHKTMLRQIPDKRLESLLREALAHPVETWGEVVYELLARVDGADFAGEFGSFLDVRVARLDPQQVGVRSIL